MNQTTNQSYWIILEAEMDHKKSCANALGAGQFPPHGLHMHLAFCAQVQPKKNVSQIKWYQYSSIVYYIYIYLCISSYLHLYRLFGVSVWRHVSRKDSMKKVPVVSFWKGRMAAISGTGPLPGATFLVWPRSIPLGRRCCKQRRNVSPGKDLGVSSSSWG